MSSDRTRWLTIVLAISVLLNLFLAGIEFGRLAFPQMYQAAVPAAGPIVPRAKIRALPVSERLAFSAVMRRHAPELRAARKEVREAKLAAKQAITAPQYDRKTVEARFGDLRRATLAQQTALHAAVAEALGTVSAGSRAAIAGGTEESVGKSR